MQTDEVELAVTIERHEARVWAAFAVAAATLPGNPLGAVCDDQHAVPLTAMTSLNFAGFNRVISLGMGNEATTTDLDDIVDFYGSLGQSRFGVEITPWATPSRLGDWLFDRGFRPAELSIVKSWRPLDELPNRNESVNVVVLNESHADDWSALHRQVRGVPRMIGPWFSAGFHAEGFVHFGVYDDDELVAGAAMYVSNGLMWKGFSATLTSHRGRGLQKAISIELLHAARELGCHTAHIESDPDTKDQVCISLLNMKKIGFRVLYERQNYLSPGAALGV